MDTEPLRVFPLDEGNESITQRGGWIKINITGPIERLAHRYELAAVRALRRTLARCPITVRIHHQVAKSDCTKRLPDLSFHEVEFFHLNRVDLELRNRRIIWLRDVTHTKDPESARPYVFLGLLDHSKSTSSDKSAIRKSCTQTGLRSSV